MYPVQKYGPLNSKCLLSEMLSILLCSSSKQIYDCRNKCRIDMWQLQKIKYECMIEVIFLKISSFFYVCNNKYIISIWSYWKSEDKIKSYNKNYFIKIRWITKIIKQSKSEIMILDNTKNTKL